MIPYRMHLRNVKKRRFNQTIRAHAEAERNINSAAEERNQVVELDQFKYELNNFKEPLVEVRDSL